MDAIDREILSHLQRDGRITLTELAARLPLSVSRCQRRVRDLEARGVIRGYRAEVDPHALGLGFSAIVFVTMRQGDSGTLGEFEARLAAIPEVVSAQRLFGEPDYLLRVATSDMTAYQLLYDEHLAGLPGVARLTSTLVQKEVVVPRPLPPPPGRRAPSG